MNQKPFCYIRRYCDRNSFLESDEEYLTRRNRLHEDKGGKVRFFCEHKEILAVKSIRLNSVENIPEEVFKSNFKMIYLVRDPRAMVASWYKDTRGRDKWLEFNYRW